MRPLAVFALVTFGACGSAAQPPDAAPAPPRDAAADLAIAQAEPPRPDPTIAIPERDGWKVIEAEVAGSIAGALSHAVPGVGSVLAAHTARVFMWELDLRKEVLRGDRVAVAWREPAPGELELGAAFYTSRAKGRTLRAYRFQAPGDDHASYWDESGNELARQLKNGPLRSYEQITALLKDRPTHQGMDFKTPVGTPIHAPRAGIVTRVDWKLSGNGHCLEMRFADGVLAKFLHLSAVKARAGSSIAAGQIVALTGNTGRSTAPHLHYQLGRGRQVVDPVDYHGVVRRKLDQAGTRALRRVVEGFEAVLPLP